jgi:hypothetical protein
MTNQQDIYLEVVQVSVCLEHAAMPAGHVCQQLHERGALGFHIVAVGATSHHSTSYLAQPPTCH